VYSCSYLRHIANLLSLCARYFSFDYPLSDNSILATSVRGDNRHSTEGCIFVQYWGMENIYLLSLNLFPRFSTSERTHEIRTVRGACVMRDLTEERTKY